MIERNKSMRTIVIAALALCGAASLGTILSPLDLSLLGLAAAAAGLVAFLLLQRRRGRTEEQLAELRRELSGCAGERDRLKEECERLKAQAEPQEQDSGEKAARKELGRQCYSVIHGEEIGKKLSAIVHEKTEEATLELTDRAHSILQTSEELNSAIQEVVGGLSNEEDGLKRDVLLLEEDQKKVESLISEFIQIRDGYTREIGQIEDSMKDVRGFVNSINDIADRTNILAINATIEAARAGQAGSGFAVIGSEVQELARSTMHIAEQITDTIEEAVSTVSSSIEQYGKKIDAAVNRLESTGQNHSEIVQTLNPHIERLSEVANTSSELSSTVHENVNEMTRHLQYQDRIKQIMAHLLQFLEELGSEARETASSYMVLGEEENEALRNSMVEKASRHFSTDEEYEAFDLSVDRGSAGEKKDEELAGDVELF